MAIILTAPLLGLGYGAAQPAFQALAIQSAPIERAGVSTATYFLALDISVGAGSIILALLGKCIGISIPIYYCCFSYGHSAQSISCMD